MKTSIQYTQKEVDELKITQAKQSEHCNTTQTDIMKLCESLQVILDKHEYLEGQSRRNNIVIDGIPETPGESWADSEEKVKDMLKRDCSYRGRLRWNVHTAQGNLKRQETDRDL